MATPEEEKALRQVLTPLLKEWRVEHDGLLKKQKALADQIEQLEEKITSAAVLLGEQPFSSHSKDDEQTWMDPFTSEVVNHIANSERGLTPSQLRQQLLEDPETEAKIRSTHPNYLYTLLSRLVLKGMLRKEGPVYQTVTSQTNSAEEPIKQSSADMFS